MCCPSSGKCKKEKGEREGIRFCKIKARGKERIKIECFKGIRGEPKIWKIIEEFMKEIQGNK